MIALAKLSLAWAVACSWLADASYHVVISSPAADAHGLSRVAYGRDIAVTAAGSADPGAPARQGYLCLKSSTVAQSCSSLQPLPIQITWDLMSEVVREELQVVLYIDGADGDTSLPGASRVEVARATRLVEIPFFDEASELLVKEHGIAPISTGEGSFELAIGLAVALGPPGGAFAEFGVYRGASLRTIAAILKRYDPTRHVHGFDAFRGLPARWRESHGAGSFDEGGAPPGNLPSNVLLHLGWFNATATPFASTLSASGNSLSFLHIDCDLYSSTMEVLAALACHLGRGSVVQFDEYFNHHGWWVEGRAAGEAAAWLSVTELFSLEFRYLGYFGTAVSVVVTKPADASYCKSIMSEAQEPPTEHRPPLPTVEIVSPAPHSTVLMEHGKDNNIMLVVRLSNVDFSDQPSLCISASPRVGYSSLSSAQGTPSSLLCTTPGQTGNNPAKPDEFILYIPNPESSQVGSEAGWFLIKVSVRVSMKGENGKTSNGDNDPMVWPVQAASYTLFQVNYENAPTKEWRQDLLRSGGRVFSKVSELISHSIEIDLLTQNDSVEVTFIELSRGEAGMNTLAESYYRNISFARKRVQFFSIVPNSRMPTNQDRDALSRTALAYNSAFCRSCRRKVKWLDSSHFESQLQDIAPPAQPKLLVVNVALSENASFVNEFIAMLVCGATPGSIFILADFLASDDNGQIYSSGATAWVDVASQYALEWKPMFSAGRAVAVSIQSRGAHCPLPTEEERFGESPKLHHDKENKLLAVNIMEELNVSNALDFSMFSPSAGTTPLSWPMIRRLWQDSRLEVFGDIISSFASAVKIHLEDMASNQIRQDDLLSSELAADLLASIGRVLYLIINANALGDSSAAKTANERAVAVLEMSVRLRSLSPLRAASDREDAESYYILAYVRFHAFREWDQAAHFWQQYIRILASKKGTVQVWPRLYAWENITREDEEHMVSTNDDSERWAIPLTASKLRHDASQLRHLASSGVTDYNPSSLEAIAEDFDALSNDLEDGGANATTCRATIASRSKRAGMAMSAYGSRLHVRPHRNAHSFTNEEIEPAQVFGEWSPAAIQEAWDQQAALSASGSGGIAVIDSFLSAAAFKEIRSFMDESTIWSDASHKEGYLGAFLDQGLANGLLLRIADELKEMFPSIFLKHRLHYAFAYTYDNAPRRLELRLESQGANRTAGIKVHADNALVNVNIWLTDLDERDLRLGEASRSNGLLIRRVEAPVVADFHSINGNSEAIERYLQKQGDFRENATFVPYAGNRCVIFSSRLFHETAPLRWPTESWNRRRINLTLLFGHPT